MSKFTKRQLLGRAESEGLDVEVRGGGWFVVSGQKVRGLDALEAAIEDAEPGSVTLCLCGCQQPVTRRFKQGHDARLKGLLLRVARGEEDADLIPPEAADRLDEIAPSLLAAHDVDLGDLLAAMG